MKTASHKPKILFVVTEDWAVLTHRKPMIRAALRFGFDVCVACRVENRRADIEALGCSVHHVPFERGNTKLLQEIRAVRSILAIIWRESPNVVLNVALKPIVDASFATLLFSRAKIVNVFTGLGYVFIQKPSRLSRFLTAAIKRITKSKRVSSIVQNKNDKAFLHELSPASASRLFLIEGSGVDTSEFSVRPLPDGPVRVTMVGRLLVDKGIREFVEAARFVKSAMPEVIFQVYGGRDELNPACVSQRELNAWIDEGVVDFVEHSDDMANVWAKSHIAVLPSYREGLPKTLLEASACGRPIVTTDAIGCRDTVRNGVNGLLVPPRNGTALGLAILDLARDTGRRERMGAESRRLAETVFSDDRIIEKMMAVYYASCPELVRDR